MNALERLGQHLASEQDALRAKDAATRRYVREGLDLLPMPSPRSGYRRLGMAAVGVSVAAAVALALWVRSTSPEPLTAVVGRSKSPVDAGAWIEASREEPLQVSFSDGTTIDMEPRSRARLVELQDTGPHVLLESGHAQIRVRRRPHARFRLSLGPFRVVVIGTRFKVRWNPDPDEFELDLLEGEVEVSGCVFGQGYRMTAGQHVRASCKQRRFDVMDGVQKAREESTELARGEETAEEQARPQSLETSQLSDQDGARHRARSATAAASRRASGWRELAKQGEYLRAFASAEAAGFETQCALANAAELWILADVARYSGAAQREAHALQLLRRRFPRTSRAALAAFSLGRLEFDRHGSYQEAARWFRTYLKEQPAGPLTREARGRLMEANFRAGKLARARQLAVEYLSDYPSGPHSGLAKSLAAARGP